MGCFVNSRLKFLKSFLANETLIDSLTWCMTLVLCSISQNCIPLLGFKTGPGLALDLQDKKLVSVQGASKVSYILGYNGKYIRLKVSCKLFLKRKVLL